MIAKLKNYAAFIKNESYALTIAVRDPRVPWYARVLLGLVLAYAFSPIDLIPDFIPVLGYLDDLIIVPLGITLALKMIPAQVMIDARKQAEDSLQHGKPVSRVGAITHYPCVAVDPRCSYLVFCAHGLGVSQMSNFLKTLGNLPVIIPGKNSLPGSLCIIYMFSFRIIVDPPRKKCPR